MDRWLGDGGMPIIAALGGSIESYGEGWAQAAWSPEPLACNPAGIVQAGVHSVLLDAVMNFAMLATLDKGDRGATLEMKVSTMRPAKAGDALVVRGEVVRLAKTIAYTEGWVRDNQGDTVSHATGTFVVRRAEA
jgi:uncharacterized protein (TIGR00369 family)